MSPFFKATAKGESPLLSLIWIRAPFFIKIWIIFSESENVKLVSRHFSAFLRIFIENAKETPFRSVKNPPESIATWRTVCPSLFWRFTSAWFSINFLTTFSFSKTVILVIQLSTNQIDRISDMILPLRTATKSGVSYWLSWWSISEPFLISWSTTLTKPGLSMKMLWIEQFWCTSNDATYPLYTRRKWAFVHLGLQYSDQHRPEWAHLSDFYRPELNWCTWTIFFCRKPWSVIWARLIWKWSKMVINWNKWIRKRKKWQSKSKAIENE